jgi:transposase
LSDGLSFEILKSRNKECYNFTTVYDESAFTSVQIEYGPSLKSIDEDDLEMRFRNLKSDCLKRKPKLIWRDKMLKCPLRKNIKKRFTAITFKSYLIEEIECF